MNATNRTVTPSQDDPWKESGAMVYVALTVATFSAVTMCCVWFILHHPSVRSWLRLTRGYDSVDDEESVQLASRSSETPSPEATDLEQASPVEALADAVSKEPVGDSKEPGSVSPDPSSEYSFTFEDSDDEEDIPLGIQETDV